MTTTYDAMRSNAERIADEQIKERVLRGIAVMFEVHGPDWPDFIDPSELLMDSPTQCVLGQAFDTYVPTGTQWDALAERWPHLAESAERLPMIARSGYLKGLAIIDGDTLNHPARYGFETDTFEPDDEGRDCAYIELTEAWLVALGEDS